MPPKDSGKATVTVQLVDRTSGIVQAQRTYAQLVGVPVGAALSFMAERSNLRGWWDPPVYICRAGKKGRREIKNPSVTLEAGDTLILDP